VRRQLVRPPKVKVRLREILRRRPAAEPPGDVLERRPEPRRLARRERRHREEHTVPPVLLDLARGQRGGHRLCEYDEARTLSSNRLDVPACVVSNRPAKALAAFERGLCPRQSIPRGRHRRGPPRPPPKEAI
jgi:hypothetical protein